MEVGRIERDVCTLGFSSRVFLLASQLFAYCFLLLFLVMGSLFIDVIFSAYVAKRKKLKYGIMSFRD